MFWKTKGENFKGKFWKEFQNENLLENLWAKICVDFVNKNTTDHRLLCRRSRCLELRAIVDGSAGPGPVPLGSSPLHHDRARPPDPAPSLPIVGHPTGSTTTHWERQPSRRRGGRSCIRPVVARRGSTHPRRRVGRQLIGGAGGTALVLPASLHARMEPR
jgi:hypothetical protein